jgi:DNA-directed RNA polymerase specialized sigma24 family protein
VSERELRKELEQLYRSRYERFLRVALGIVGDDAAAKDAVQEGFARALKGLAGFSRSGPLEGWVWRIVVNAALAVQGDRLLLADGPELPAVGPAPEVDEVRRWVARLPERQRLAVFLRYYADLDYRSIAAALEIEPGTVSATLSAAHSALRSQLEEVRQ